MANRLQVDPAQVATRIKALDAGGYVKVDSYQGNGAALDITLLRDAREAIGQWPARDQVFQKFLSAIDAVAAAEPDEEKRSKLRTAAGVIGGAGRDFAVQVTATMLSNQLGS